MFSRFFSRTPSYLQSRAISQRLGQTQLRGFSTAGSIAKENKYAAHNYHPVPIVFHKAEGVHVWDPEGTHYYDMLSAYSAVNQGHCHPKIVEAMNEQSHLAALSSRAFYNDKFPDFAEYVTQYFGYENVLPMNTGAEAVDSALKLARKYAYDKKGIPEDEAIILSACGCFHGRTFGAIAMSCDPDATDGFGPHLPNMDKVKYNNLESLENKLKEHNGKVAAFVVEPIQGEAGVVVPDDGYLKAAYDLCKKYDALFIADEVQTGIARTGKMLAVEHEGVRPDAVILGKAISGGMYPVSCVLADHDIMEVLTPGTHGSTYGGNPMAAAISIAALDVIKDEGLVENANRLGKIFRQEFEDFNSPIIKTVRGKGLLNAFVIEHNDSSFDKTAWDLVLLLKSRGILAKHTQDHIIRFTPPLVINEEQLRECIDIIKSCLTDIVDMPRTEIPGASPEKPESEDVFCKRCGDQLML